MAARSILVTGASGFLGSRLVKQLVAQGEHVRAMVRPGAQLGALTGLPKDRMQLVYGDVLVGSTVYRALSGCNRLFHVATNFSMWSRDPRSIIEPAVSGTEQVLQAARQRGIERIVVTSSAAILGTTSSPESIGENHAFNLTRPETYVEAKVRANRVVEEAVAGGAPVVTVLPSILFGPGDWKPTPNGRLLLSYLRNSPDFRIPVVEGGINIADVDDVAVGHLLAMQKGRIGQRYVLGGNNVTFRELVKTLADLTGLALPGVRLGRPLVAAVAQVAELVARMTGSDPAITPRMVESRVGRYLWVKSEKAEHELGYRARSLRETLDRSIRWFLRNRYLTEQQMRRIWLELRAG
jgi:dihydroflavonol-4-reductase